MFRLTLLLSILIATATSAPNDHAARSTITVPSSTGMLHLLNHDDVDYGLEVSTRSRRRFLNETIDDDDHNHDHDHDHDNETKKKKWGEVIGLTLIVNLATLSGVLFFIPLLSRKARAWVKSVCWSDAVPTPHPPVAPDQDEELARKTHILDLIVPSFASGALLATAVFLIIPEAIALIQSYVGGHEEEEAVRFLAIEGEVDAEVHDEHEGEITPDAIWRFGASLLAGFLLPLLIEAVAASFRHKDGDQCNTTDQTIKDDIEAKTTENPTPVETKVKWGLVTTIIVGDAFHNFCDGIFIGVALSLCSRTTAYTIMAITLYHEIAQELADYFLLTKHAGLKPLHALSLNFVSGLSVLLGGIAVLVSPISDLVIGVLLSIASGVYIYIAACECMPRVQAVLRSSTDRIVSIMMFIIGAVPIGLALLNHSHCEAESHADH